MSKPRRFSTLRIGTFLAVSLIGALARPAFGQLTPVSWTGGATGNWFTGTNWSGGTVPSNGGGVEYAVTIASPSGVNVSLDSNAAIDSLNLSATNGVLSIAGTQLFVTNANSAGISIASGDSMQISSSGILFVAGNNVSTSGGGSITLSSSGSIRATADGQVLTNGTTINGAGNLGVNGGLLVLANQASGVIDANVNSQMLTLAPTGASSNAGLLRASNGGTLTIGGNGGFTNTGTITALDASTVNLNGTTVTGGTGNSFTTAGTGIILGTSVTLDGTTKSIVNSGAFQVSSTTAKGTLTNNGTISFATSGILFLGGDLTLNGSGAVTLANNSSSIRATADAQTLTNATTINGGSGNGIGVNGALLIVANQVTGLIDANISAGTLGLAPFTGSTNAGTFRASNGGTLNIAGGRSFTNTGTVSAQDNSTVNLNNITVIAGAGNNFTTAGTGVILGTNVALDGMASAVVNAGSFQVASTSAKGTLTNNGAISFATFGTLSLAGDLTVNGSGKITLGNNSSSIRATVDAQTLTNAATITGAGNLGVNGALLVISNQAPGVIEGSVSGATTTMQPFNDATHTSTNAGILRASNGGIFTIQNGAITNTGTITAVGTGSTPVSTVNLNSITLVGGTNGQLTTTSNGQIGTTSTTLDGTTAAVVNNGTLVGSSTTTVKGTITNNGAISFATFGIFNLGANTTLNGSGTLTLDNNSSSIRVASDGLVLTNASTINGAGGIGVNGANLGLANQAAGLIDANVSGGTLAVQAIAGLTNAGTMRASNGGTLTFQGSGTFSSTGTIIALTGSTVNLSSGTLAGGSLSTTGTGVINASGTTFDGTTAAVVNNGTLVGSNTTTVKGTITNNGAISFASSGIFNLGANTALGGSGTLTLGNNSSSIRVASDGLVLTNGSTINGAGNIGVNGANLGLTNQAAGIIDSNVSAGTLTVQALAGLTNAGTMQASNGGTLTFQGSGTFSSTGTIAALNASSVNLNGGTLAGGSLSTSGTGVINASGTALDGTTTAVVNGGNLVGSNTTLVKGTISNNGAISFANFGTFNLGANTTLGGTGTLTLGNNSSSIRVAADGLVLSNASTINGAGNIGVNGALLGLANQAGGLIDANVSSATLTVQADSGLTNAGTLRASNGGTLTFQGTGTFSSTGAITALTGSTVNLSSGTLAGGTLSTVGTGVINATGTTLDGTTTAVVNNGNLFGINTTTVKGTITNNGAISFASFGIFSLGANTTLGGTGTLTLGNNSSSIRVAADGLVLSNASTVNGAGGIGVNGANLVLANQNGGLIDANVNATTLSVNTSGASTNAGTLRASNGGTLNYVTVAGGTLDNTGGTIRAQTGSTVSLLGASLTNLSGTTLTGGSYQASGTGSVLKLANNANVTILAGGASVTLDGPGTIVDQNGNDAVRNLTAINSLGSLLLFNGHNETVGGGAVINAGTLQINNSTTLTVSTGGYAQTAGLTQLTDPGSALTVAGGLMFSGGTLKGNGVVNGNVNNTAGTIAPGNSPGMLTINGTLGMGGGSIFQAEIGGAGQGTQYDFLSDNGATTLGGALQIVLVNSFTPTGSQTFTILTDTGALAGAFANVANGGRVLVGSGPTSFQVNYGPGSPFGSNNVVLSNFAAVPEPGTLALCGIATALAGLKLRMRRMTRRRT
jgi:hypothetical protein